MNRRPNSVKAGKPIEHRDCEQMLGHSSILLTREQMIARGAYGFLHKALEGFVLLEKVIVLVNDPACGDWASYTTSDQSIAIELKYSSEEQRYFAFNGPQIIQDAIDGGATLIRAYIEPDDGDFGSFAFVDPSGLSESLGGYIDAR